MSIWTDLLGSQIYFAGGKYRTRVIEYGQGEPLLLLHGGGGHAEAFARNVVRFGQHFRTLAIDMLWHGLSSKPPFPTEVVPGYSDRATAEQILDLFDDLGIDRAHVEGEAIGGRVALCLAIEHPERLRKLVLTNTSGVRYKPGSIETRDRSQYERAATAAITGTSRESVRARLEQVFVDPSLVTDELVEVRYRFYSDPETNAAQEALRAYGSDGFEEEQVATISAPTIVMTSDRNPFRGPDSAERLAGLVKNGRWLLMENSAIWLQWEQAEKHDRIVLEFLLS